MSNERRRYRWTNRILAVFVVAYVVIAVERERVNGRDELFPFAAWSLFTLVPNQTHDFSLRILQVDGQTLERPVYFENAGEFFPWSGKNAARMSIQRLGRALARGDTGAAAAERRHVETMHLGNRPGVRYVVVSRSYDAIRRWREGAFDTQRTLATFEIAPATAGGHVGDSDAAVIDDAKPTATADAEKG